MNEPVPFNSVEPYRALEDADYYAAIGRIIVQCCLRHKVDPRHPLKVARINGWIWQDLLKSGLLRPGMDRQRFVRGLADRVWDAHMNAYLKDYRATPKKVEEQRSIEMESNENEFNALREVIAKQKERIAELESAVQCIEEGSAEWEEQCKQAQKNVAALQSHFVQASEVDLNELALQGASEYCKKTLGNMPLEERQLILNACASGIIMGFRRKEASMDIKQNGGKNAS
jgi:hypothetical protein